jgi:hypothetical protein
MHEDRDPDEAVAVRDSSQEANRVHYGWQTFEDIFGQHLQVLASLVLVPHQGVWDAKADSCPQTLVISQLIVG